MSDDSIRKIETALHEICERLRAVELNLAALQPRMCPSPGMCLGLQGRVNEHEEKIVALKTSQDQMVGGLLITRVLWVFISTVIASVTSGVIAYAITH